MIVNIILIALIVLAVFLSGFSLYINKKRKGECFGCSCYETCGSKNCSCEKSPDGKSEK
ncbi:MAG: hypothetical protein IIW10_05770 [Spirochaetaceae bacterium]|nr:hypothetical protein [Spirochaetaceae bacterium]